MTVSFYGGGETTGGVADRRIDTTTARQETTGGVGVRKNQESIFAVDNDLQQDTVNFKGRDNQNKKHSAVGTLLTATAITAGIIGLLGLSHKYDWVGKIKNEKVQKIFRHTDTVAEPCHKACAWVKKNCYDKVVKMFKK